MDLSGRKIWQMAAGDTDRNFADLCLKWGVIVLGPGTQGPMADPEASGRYRHDGISARMVGMLRKFYDDIKAGDVVVLRIGLSEVHGVGVIIGEYGWHDAFLDVDGWDVCHFYHVHWIWKKSDESPAIFKGALKFGDSLQSISQNEKTKALLDWMAGLVETDPPAVMPPLPVSGRNLTIEELCQPLYDYGIGLSNLAELKDCILELQALARWYKKYSSNPSEHETVTHLIVPLLRALGWTPQRIALEYHQSGKGRADIALYSYGNRQNQYLTAIVEAKKFEKSCLRAEAQVRSYAAKHTDRLIVTDGIRYGVFVQGSEGLFPETPSAYLNLTKFLDGYKVYGDSCAGADQALLIMSADWRPGLPKPSLANRFS